LSNPRSDEHTCTVEAQTCSLIAETPDVEVLAITNASLGFSRDVPSNKNYRLSKSQYYMPMNTTQLRKQIKNKKINVKNNNPTKRLNVKNNSEKKETK
jgi:hypothetical protein